MPVHPRLVTKTTHRLGNTRFVSSDMPALSRFHLHLIMHFTSFRRNGASRTAERIIMVSVRGREGGRVGIDRKGILSFFFFF